MTDMSDAYESVWSVRLKWLYVLAVVGALMTPVFYNFYVSLNEFGFGAARYAVTLKWYRAVFTDAQLLDAMGWTLKLAAATAAVTVPFGLLAAKLYKRLTRKLWLVFLMLLPLFAPADIFASSLLVFFKSLGDAFTAIAEATGLWFLDGWFRLGFVTAWIALVIYTLPYVFVTILITMGRYRPEQTEAARACGATAWEAFRDVEFPQIRPGVLASTAFTVILVFNEYVRSNALKGGFDTFTTVLISQMLNTGMSEQSYAMGGLVSAVAIVIVGAAIAVSLATAAARERRMRGLAQGEE